MSTFRLTENYNIYALHIGAIEQAGTPQAGDFPGLEANTEKAVCTLQDMSVHRKRQPAGNVRLSCNACKTRVSLFTERRMISVRKT